METETAEWKGRVEKESEERKGERDVLLAQGEVPFV